MKTPLTELIDIIDIRIEFLMKFNNIHSQQRVIELNNIKMEAQSLLPKEKEGIKDVAIKFFYHWLNHPGNNIDEGFDKYFNSTYQENSNKNKSTKYSST